MFTNIPCCLTAIDFTAPSVPEEATKYFPSDTDSFGAGLLQILKKAIQYINPCVADGASICVSLIAMVLLITILNSISKSTSGIYRLVGTVAIAIALIEPSNTLINLGIKTIEEMSNYGKLLLPVMTAALAAEGGLTSSAALYTGTVIFNTVLSSLLSSLFVPLIYAYIALSIAYSAIGNEFLAELSKFIKWLLTWILKITLYVFTGYISITGIVSGTADAAAVKATKIAISGAIPVVGNIISDASETILVSAGVVKNAVGVFGMLAILALWIGPFLQIAVQYLFLKATAGLCSLFGDKCTGTLVKDFSGVMGYLLAATGTMCLMLLISTVTFMRGMQ